jgi:hypothetical protein
MRLLIGAGLAGASLVLLTACGKPAGNAASAAAPGASPAPTPAAAPAASGPVALDQVPHRKPGLWEQTVSVQGMPSGMGMATKLCVDETSEAKMSLVAQHAPNAHCDTPQFTRNLDGSLSFSNRCDLGHDGKSQSQGQITGDFQSGYTMVIDTTISGAAAPSMNRETKMTVTSKWTGPCAPGQKGGDMVLPNGMTFNALHAGPPAGRP